VPQPGVDVSEGEGDELVGEAPKEFLGRRVVPVLESRQEFSEGVRHGSRPSRSRNTDLWPGAANFLPISEAARIYSMESWWG
jgi:hypothetical protein